MLDLKELNKFASLPPVFNRDFIPIIENIIDEYDACRSYVRKKIDNYGNDAFKKPDVYQQVIWDIKWDWEKAPKSIENKLVAVAELMKKENCNEEYPD